MGIVQLYVEPCANSKSIQSVIMHLIQMVQISNVIWIQNHFVQYSGVSKQVCLKWSKLVLKQFIWLSGSFKRQTEYFFSLQIATVGTKIFFIFVAALGAGSWCEPLLFDQVHERPQRRHHGLRCNKQRRVGRQDQVPPGLLTLRFTSEFMAMFPNLYELLGAPSYRTKVRA